MTLYHPAACRRGEETSDPNRRFATIQERPKKPNKKNKTTKIEPTSSDDIMANTFQLSLSSITTNSCETRRSFNKAEAAQGSEFYVLPHLV